MNNFIIKTLVITVVFLGCEYTEGNHWSRLAAVLFFPEITLAYTIATSLFKYINTKSLKL